MTRTPGSERGAAGDGRPYRHASFSFTVTAHDPDRLWIVTGVEQRTVELEDGVDFFGWARAQWPAKRFTVQLDPWQLLREDRDAR